MARKLQQNVFVAGEFYAAGSTPDKDVAEQITNPKAWGDEDEGEKQAPNRKSAPKSE